MRLMLSGNELWSLMSMAVALFSLALGVYVIRANPSARAARVFFLIMVLMFVGGCTDFLFMNAPEKDQAMILAGFLLFTLVLEMGSLLYLATFLPYESSSGWFRERWWLFFVVVGATGLIPVLFLGPEQVDRTSYGWGVEGSTALASFAVIMVIYALIADGMLASTSLKTKERNARAQIVIVALAATAPIIYAVAYSTLDLVIEDFPPILSPGYLISALIMAYAVLRYRLFTIEVKEDKSSKHIIDPSIRRLEHGMSILYLGNDARMAIATFENEVSAGSVGVLVSHIHPDVLREKYGVKRASTIWLARQQGEKHIDPSNLNILQMSISDFLHQHEGAVVLIEGVEYLLANNSLESVLKVLYALDDEVVVTKGLLLVSLDPQGLSKKGLAMFVRDFQVVEVKEGRDRDLNSGLGIHSPTG
jgi:hypothetical protein